MVRRGTATRQAALYWEFTYQWEAQKALMTKEIRPLFDKAMGQLINAIRRAITEKQADVVVLPFEVENE